MHSLPMLKKVASYENRTTKNWALTKCEVFGWNTVQLLEFYELSWSVLVELERDWAKLRLPETARDRTSTVGLAVSVSLSLNSSVWLSLTVSHNRRITVVVLYMYTFGDLIDYSSSLLLLVFSQLEAVFTLCLSIPAFLYLSLCVLSVLETRGQGDWWSVIVFHIFSTSSESTILHTASQHPATSTAPAGPL